jgi:hypothetical protein
MEQISIHRKTDSVHHEDVSIFGLSCRFQFFQDPEDHCAGMK